MVRSLVMLSALMVALLAPRPAHAYLDPTSGSILLQVLLGGVAGAVLALKLFWGRILSWFSLGERDRDEPAP